MVVTTPDPSLTRGTLLARNVALNIAGAVVPAAAALIAVPFLVRGLGDARFGLLALAWTALGYFSLFDMGVGRAVTHAVAESSGSADAKVDAGSVIWAALLILTPVGTAGAVALFLSAEWLATTLGTAQELRSEATLAFRVLAVAIPFAAIAGALRGALEGKQYFGAVNALRIPHGLLTFLGPLLALPFSRSLVPAIAILTAGRIAVCLAHLAVVRRLLPEFGDARPHWNRAVGARLLTFGGWLQVTYVVSPVMATLDRFVVGAVLGIQMVAYYATPNELVTKLWLFVLAASPVFFSAFSVTGTRDPARTAALFDRMLRMTLSAVFLPALVLIALAPEILRIWLGESFVAPSTEVMQILAIAVFVNCLGQGAYTLIQALGRPDLTGKYHLLELPLYGLLLWWLLPRYGLVGAAMAWSIRTIGDTIVLLATCPRLLPQSRRTVARMSLWLVATSSVLAGSMLLHGITSRVALAMVATVAWLGIVWRFLLTPQERRLPVARLLNGAMRPEQAQV